MRHPIRSFAGLVAVVALIGGLAACEPAPTELTVEVTGRSGASVAYTVRCGPQGPEVTPPTDGIDAADACAVASARAGLLVEGPSRDGFCAQMIMGWERATVRGRVDDRPVEQAFGRNDSCADADYRSLIGLLPPV